MDNLNNDIKEFINSLDEDTKAILKGIGHFTPKLTINQTIINNNDILSSGLQVIESADEIQKRRK